MCGVSGIIYKDSGRVVSEDLLRKMNEVVAHRGPDDSGVNVCGNVGLAHVRLSIIDLSQLGHQPMSNEDGTVRITFNGEIYNFPELRKRLETQGHIFRSHTDTETVVHLYEEEGETCVEHLDGMFAFAIWDNRKKILFAARDRMGKKPLFYADLKDRFVFASEIKSMIQDPGFKAEPDLQAIYHYLAYQSVPSPMSAFKGVRKLPPAHSMTYKDGILTVKRYWKLSCAEQFKITNEMQEIDLQHEIIDRLKTSVKQRLMSDVPLGAFLSGGIDSSIVVALMAEIMDRPVKTFSIGFKEEEYNELPYARMVAERYKTEHHEFIVTPDAKDIIPKLVWHYNEPFADSSAIPTYYVSQMARQFVTVVLTGDGGDENFAGYSRYRRSPVHEEGVAKSVLRRIYNRVSLKSFMGSGFFKDIRRLRNLTPEKLAYYYRITHFHEHYQEKLLTPGFRAGLGGVKSVDYMLGIYAESEAKDFLSATLELDFAHYMPDTLMVKGDIAAMAHSLETRMPMLDHHFIEFAAKIPSALKLKNGTECKYILKKALEPYLPKDIICRKKMGFGVPIDHWFRNELKEMTYDVLLSSAAMNRGYFSRAYIQSVLDKHNQNTGESWHYLIWNLLMLELWHLMFVDKTWGNKFTAK